jgi:hypothetical protein
MMAIGCNVHANRAFAGLPPIHALAALPPMKNSRAPLGAKISSLARLPAAVGPPHGMGWYAATSDEEVREIRSPPSSVILAGALPAPGRREMDRQMPHGFIIVDDGDGRAGSQLLILDNRAAAARNPGCRSLVASLGFDVCTFASAEEFLQSPRLST